MGNMNARAMHRAQRAQRAKASRAIAKALDPPSPNVICRNRFYPKTNLQRAKVPDDKVSWSVPWPTYRPWFHEELELVHKAWADPILKKKLKRAARAGKAPPPPPSFAEAAEPTSAGVDSPEHPRISKEFADIQKFAPRWNKLDGDVNRISHHGPYQIKYGLPLNPGGRTGIHGRGCLGRWGPNHAGDPVVTRWRRYKGQLVRHHKSCRLILQFCAIKRRDTGEWAIPGGMVDLGEHIADALLREFSEEALNLMGKGPQCSREKERLRQFFKCGVEIYRGYVDDPRNTDNAWMETVVMNFHDNTGEEVGKFELCAGDDAVKARWMDIDSEAELYANHLLFLKMVAVHHEAHF